MLNHELFTKLKNENQAVSLFLGNEISQLLTGTIIDVSTTKIEFKDTHSFTWFICLSEIKAVKLVTFKVSQRDLRNLPNF